MAAGQSEDNIGTRTILLYPQTLFLRIEQTGPFLPWLVLFPFSSSALAYLIGNCGRLLTREPCPAGERKMRPLLPQRQFGPMPERRGDGGTDAQSHIHTKGGKDGDGF